MRFHEVTFRDAEFPHHFGLARTRAEGVHLRWIPHGMPRLNQALLNASFFLYEKNPNEPSDSENYLGPCGSGVIVGLYDLAAPRLLHLYAVTAAHVACTGGSIIQINTNAGRRRPIEFDPAEWAADLSWEDIAAVDITDRLWGGDGGDTISHIPFRMFATEIEMRRFQMGVGEDGFMLGLFDGQPGKTANLIAARFGNVSLLADDKSPIERFDPGTKTTFNTPCHIFDMHSRPGTSGSPVFVFRTPDSDLRDLENQTLPRRRLEMEGGPTVAEFGLQGRYPNYNEYWEYLDPDSRFLKLLGIHVGQFHDDVEITKVSDTASEGKLYRNLQDGDTIRFPGSMSIVVPAWQIAKLLEFPDLRKQRAARRRLLGDSAAANPTRSRVVLESLRKGLAEPAADNPSHKEDFTSLLGRAARAKPEAGQT